MYNNTNITYLPQGLLSGMQINDRRRTYIKLKPKSMPKLAIREEEDFSSDSEDEAREEQDKKEYRDWQSTPLFKRIRRMTVSILAVHISTAF